MKQTTQISESIQLGIILALSGGFMDAYSYMCRGKVFANAQTGNILLFGVNISTGNFYQAFKYLFPVVAFVSGIAMAEILRYKTVQLQKKNIHWRQLAVLIEAVIFFFVGFLSQEWNALANALVSFACGIQVESFRKIRGNGIATTMCIGNIRTATQHVCDYMHTKQSDILKKGCFYYGIIIIFVIGAVLGNLCVKWWEELAIEVSAVCMLLSFGMMFFSAKREERK